MTWLALALAAFWIALVAVELRGVCSLRELPPHRADSKPTTVTAVMAVRDDRDHVRASVQRLLEQRDVDLRLVVVDDRSVDGTDEVLAALAADEPRLDVRKIRSLPAGWLGKCHALHEGTRDAASPWLLFVDGDSRLAPDLVARAVAAADAANAHHVALLPTIEPSSLPGKGCLLAFQSVVADRLRRVNTTPQRAFVGTGAFNLVRADAYGAIGRHEGLRLEVVDDVWLGGLLFRAGFRSRLWIASRDLSVDWGGTPGRLFRDVEKNMFAVLRYRTVAALLLGIGGVALVLASLSAPWWAGAPGLAATAAFLATAVAPIVLARRLGWPVASALLSPLGRLVLPLALLRSTLTTTWRGGVSWRGTFYPLAELRRSQAR
ncbi:MAG: glycosyltransferase [Planctomycetes bacterium]|nr:glycosyltransferase [Planctomycetota bacterium]